MSTTFKLWQKILIFFFKNDYRTCEVLRFFVRNWSCQSIFLIFQPSVPVYLMSNVRNLTIASSVFFCSFILLDQQGEKVTSTNAGLVKNLFQSSQEASNGKMVQINNAYERFHDYLKRAKIRLSVRKNSKKGIGVLFLGLAPSNHHQIGELKQQLSLLGALKLE